MMKTIFCALFLLCATVAFSQSAPVLSSTSQPMTMNDHVQHASVHAMGQENTLLDTTVYSFAKGEVPLSELGSIEYETPLGDVARAFRKEHAALPAKATKVLEK
jgi:hypothetical protein